MTTDTQETGIPLWGFVAGAALLIVAALAAVWFMFPAPDTRHDLVSPSGAVRLELGELCGETGCTRVAILDVGGQRQGCQLALEGNQPLFEAVTAAWAADESSVELSYVAADGTKGALSIAQADCSPTQ
ncbi:hypothetical protein [Devosia sp. A449]